MWVWLGRVKELRSDPAILSFIHLVLVLPDMVEHCSYSGNNYNLSPRLGR